VPLGWTGSSDFTGVLQQHLSCFFKGEGRLMLNEPLLQGAQLLNVAERRWVLALTITRTA
jgi:hypothetical protein